MKTIKSKRGLLSGTNNIIYSKSLLTNGLNTCFLPLKTLMQSLQLSANDSFSFSAHLFSAQFSVV